jgi:hypothetical protein
MEVQGKRCEDDCETHAVRHPPSGDAASEKGNERGDVPQFWGKQTLTISGVIRDYHGF